MAKQSINVGTAANDKKGDSLRAAFQKVNANFTELYTELGLVVDANLNLGAFEFAGSTLSTTDSSAIVIDQATTITSNLSVGGDIVPQTANGGDLGSSTLPWKSLYVSNNTIFIGGTAVGVDANGALTTGGTVVGSTPAWANITGKPTFAAVATTGAYADLTGKPTIPTLVSQLSNDSGFLTSVSNIQSESDISIQVNLTDSTKRIWRFGEDGDLETPGGIQVAGILKIDNGVHEKFQTKADATGIVTHDCSLGHIFYHTSPDALFTVNFTNLNLSSGYATALTLIIVQGGTGFIPNSVGIGGVIQTLNWQGNVTPTPSTNRTDVVTFSIINNAGTYTVLGQLTGF